MGGASLDCLPGGKGEYWKAKRMTNGLASPFLFSIEAMKRNSNLALPSKLRLNSSSLVNKQVGSNCDNPMVDNKNVCVRHTF